MADVSWPSNNEIRDFVATRYGQHIGSYFSSPITDQGYLNQLRSEASAFRTGTNTLAVALDIDHVYDLGGDAVNDSLTLGLIDSKSSSSLIDYLSTELQTRLSADQIQAVFVTRRFIDTVRSRRLGALVFGRRQFMLVHRNDDAGADRNLAETLIVDAHGAELAYQSIRRIGNAEEARTTAARLNALLPPAGARFAGMYNRALLNIEGTWSWAALRNLGRIAVSERRRRRLFDAGEYIVTMPSHYDEAPEWRHIPVGAVTVAGMSQLSEVLATDARASTGGAITNVSAGRYRSSLVLRKELGGGVRKLLHHQGEHGPWRRIDCSGTLYVQDAVAVELVLSWRLLEYRCVYLVVPRQVRGKLPDYVCG